VTLLPAAIPSCITALCHEKPPAYGPAQAPAILALSPFEIKLLNIILGPFLTHFFAPGASAAVLHLALLCFFSSSGSGCRRGATVLLYSALRTIERVQSQRPALVAQRLLFSTKPIDARNAIVHLITPQARTHAHVYGPHDRVWSDVHPGLTARITSEKCTASYENEGRNNAKRSSDKKTLDFVAPRAHTAFSARAPVWFSAAAVT